MTFLTNFSSSKKNSEPTRSQIAAYIVRGCNVCIVLGLNVVLFRRVAKERDGGDKIRGGKTMTLLGRVNCDKCVLGFLGFESPDKKCVRDPAQQSEQSLCCRTHAGYKDNAGHTSTHGSGEAHSVCDLESAASLHHTVARRCLQTFPVD